VIVKGLCGIGLFMSFSGILLVLVVFDVFSVFSGFWGLF